MDITETKIVIGLATDDIKVIDLLTLRELPKEGMSNFCQSQIKCVACMPNQNGYIVGQLDGRITIKNF